MPGSRLSAGIIIGNKTDTPWLSRSLHSSTEIDKKSTNKQNIDLEDFYKGNKRGAEAENKCYRGWTVFCVIGKRLLEVTQNDTCRDRSDELQWGHSLRTRHCAKRVTNRISFSPHDNSMR